MMHNATIYIFILELMIRSPLQQRKVLADEVNTRIDCDVTNSSAVNVSWSFNGIHLPNSFIDGIEECKNRTGIFQLRHQPSSLIICQMNQTVHVGVYTCHARSPSEYESRDMKLDILGNIIFTFKGILLIISQITSI